MIIKSLDSVPLASNLELEKSLPLIRQALNFYINFTGRVMYSVMPPPPFSVFFLPVSSPTSSPIQDMLNSVKSG
ncbi:hypothetical protein SC499_03765 [Peribacillus simplex]|uniref:hypothetical protein n=1 Tax=Peribacillus simplex TaxID=1478 RepID=UPI00298ECBEE|nr:hypothetical protein [Peribacillus simplex]MDW7613852.1 hypothetical protein [Peribacillus simplex]